MKWGDSDTAPRKETTDSIHDPVIAQIALICGRVIVGGIMVFFMLVVIFLLLWIFHHFTGFVGRY